MAQVQYPYLDLTVLPNIRPHVISASAAVLFDKELSQVLWANGEGANYIGSPAIRQALEGNMSINPAMLRQIRTAADRLHSNDKSEMSAIMRVRRGFKTRLINFTISRIDLPGGEQAYLLLTERLHGRRHTKADMVHAAVNCLDGYSHASAILDGRGAVIASSEHFATLEVSTDDLAQIAHEANTENDRLVKRPVGTNTGPMPSGMARLQDDPPLHLLVIANIADNATTGDEAIADMQDIAVEDEQDNDEAAQSRVGAFSNKRTPLNSGASERWYYKPIKREDEFDDLEIEDGFDAELSPLPSKDVVLEKSEDVLESSDDIFEASDNAEKSAIEEAGLVQTSQYTSTAKTSEIADANSSRPTETELDSDIQTEAEQETAPEFEQVTSSISASTERELTNDARPVRFIWEMDDSETFTSTSPELADSVGEMSANLTGRSWTEVAEAYGFENGEEISLLLKKGDTWSGKTVLWPVEGTDLRVPVDLAGLPSYGRNRNFDGFNGFGIIRKADAVIDPEGTGLSLDTAFNKNKQSAAEAKDDKVVDLAQRRNGGQERSLSSGEQDTFREIAEKLGHVTSTDDDQNILRDDEPSSTDIEQDAIAETPNVASDKVVLTPDHDVDTSILARLPIPVLVYRENELLFANDEFFDLTGYEELEGLAARGGVDVLFGVGSDMSSNQIYHADGNTLDVHAHIQRVPWDDRKAMLLTLRLGEGPANEAANETGDGPHLSSDSHDSQGGSRAADVTKKPSGVRLVKPEDTKASSISEEDSKSPANEAFGGLSGEDLRSILDTATDGVIILSDEGVVRAINKSAEALFDQDSNDIQGQSFTKLLAPESQRAALDYLRGLSDVGVASLLNDGREVIGRTAKGGLLPLFMTIGKLESTDACCAVVRDITAWKRAEEDLLTARAEAEKANEQKTEFLARISHEIRTPLNAIIGFSDMMIEERFGRIENDRYRGYLRDIQKSGSHVLDLVNDLLDISKIEAGKMELSFDACNLNTIVSETVAMNQPEANKERVIIRTSLSAVVPKVVADPRSLKQIVLNLVSNSIKFTKSGGQVIVSTVYEDSGEVVLRVRDTGVGMSEIELAKAMQPFEQLSTTMDARKQGTGLGLPLTKAMVEANRAQFHIESTPEEGTLVEVHFPSQRVLADR